MTTPDIEYELYSVPSYENRYPEIIKGSDIGSTKVTVEENDILVCKINPRINRVWVVEHHTEHTLIASSKWVIIRSKSNNSRYLMYYFQSPVFRNYINSKLTGIGGSLTRAQPKQIAKYPVPLPPLETQKQIAANLDKVTRTIDICNAILENLDLLVKARFVEMFGDLADPDCKWDKRMLVDVCENPDDIKCGPFGTQLGKGDYTECGIAVWEIPQINSEFKTTPTHFITSEKAIELDPFSIKPGDIAMSRKGNVGRCAVFPDTFESGIIHSDVLRIRVNNKVAIPEFMMRQLHYSGDVQHQIQIVSSGAIMAGINVTKLKQIFVYIPPLALQEQFAAFVAQTDKSKVAVQNILAKAETLKKALMQEYFG